MHKIAIVKVTDDFCCYSYSDYDHYSKIIHSITDWIEVSDEDFKALKWAQGQSQQTETRWFVLEAVVEQATFVAETVAQYIKQAQAAQKKAEAAEAKRKKDAEVKAAAAKAKAEEKEKKKLADLLKKHGLPMGATIGDRSKL